MEPTSLPPGAWPRAVRVVSRIQKPFERFMAIEASSGLVLMAASLLALLFANSAWNEYYQKLWHIPWGLQIGGWSYSQDFHWWINDVLMSLFFLVVGIEIRHEIHHGELRDLKRASLPIAAALGGMLIPALIYVSLNYGRPSAVGWGVPMATDIAFALGVFALLGSRVPPSLRFLLLSLAVLDDLGAILVIAFFYSKGVSFGWIAAAMFALGGIRIFQGFGLRSGFFYLPLVLTVWIGIYAAGVHPTIAGVLLGVFAPVEQWLGKPRLLRLQKWVAYAIMPLFAFANAGVAFGAVDISGDALRVFLGIFFGLVIGKPVGVFLLTRGVVSSKLSALPQGISWSPIGVVGMVAGIGFTMSLFIAQLAFPSGNLLETAKLAIFAASITIGVLGYLAGRRILKTPPAKTP